MNETKKTPQEIIKNIINALNTNPRAFALGMNQPYSKIYDIWRGKTQVFSMQVAESITNKYGVRREYLVSGEGEMFQPKVASVRSSDPITESFLNVVSQYSNQIIELKKRIAELEEELEKARKE